MNILIIGYYGFEDGYYAYGKHFQNYFKTVSFFPLIECRDSTKNNTTSIADIDTVISGGDFAKNVYSPKLINHKFSKNVVLIAHNNDMLSSLKIDNILVIEYIIHLKKNIIFNLYKLTGILLLTTQIIMLLTFSINLTVLTLVY